MRLLNRPLRTTLAPPPRSRSPGCSSCCSGLLLTGGLYSAFVPRRRRRRQATDAAQIKQGRELFSSAARPATASTARASRPTTAGNSARRWSASAPRPSTSRSAPAGCPPASPARRSRRRKSVYTAGGDRGTRGVRRLARPRPGDPEPGGLQPRADDRRGAPGGDRARWPDLPDQLHGLPQLRRAPAARCRVAATRRRSVACTPKYIYEAMLTGPQPMPNFSDGNLTPGGEARHHRLPPDAAGRSPATAGSALGGLGPVTEGLFGLARRHRRPGRRARSGSPQHRPGRRRRRQGRGVSDDDLPETTGGDRTPGPASTSRSRTPGSSRTSGVRPTSTRSAEKRAERQVAGLFCLAIARRDRCSRLLLRVPIGDDTADILGDWRLQPRPRRLRSAWPCWPSASAPSSGRAS